MLLNKGSFIGCTFRSLSSQSSVFLNALRYLLIFGLTRSRVFSWTPPLFSRCQEGFLGEYCQHRDPCEKNRCQNGGTCVAQAMLGKATCRCALGFTWDDCQYSTTHPCFVSHPCLNGGTCHVRSRDDYEYTCQVGFPGNKCDSGLYFPILSRYLSLASLRSWHVVLKDPLTLVYV